MVSFDYILKDPMGLHSRPAALLIKKVKEYHSEVYIIYNGEKINVLRMIAVMRLCTKCGDRITLEIEGEDENTVLSVLSKYLEEIV